MRKALKTDIAEIQNLWETCFPDESGFNAYFFENIFDLSHILLWKENEKICAMLQRIPYRLSINGKIENITYIYGACTAPEQRKKGYMAKLLEASFEMDRQEGKAASALIPAEKWLFGFYEKFGYETFGATKNVKITKGTEKREMPKRLSEKDIPALSNCYQNAVEGACIHRGKHEWIQQIRLFDHLGKGVFGFFEEDKLCAYAFCWQDSVQEAFGLNPAREQGLLELVGKAELTYTTAGEETALAMIKWHVPHAAKSGYFNLMLN